MKHNSRTCPQCSTKNRLDKEYCVKCGEPLEDVPAGDPTDAKESKPGFQVTGQAEAQSPLIPIFLLLVTLGIFYAALRLQEGSPLGVFATATPTSAPVVLATSSPLAAPPGVDDYSAGITAMRAGDYKLAVERLRKAVAAENRADYRVSLAEALEKSGAQTDALAEYGAAAALAPGNGLYVGQWARALNRAGRNTEAIDAYEASLTLDQENVALLRELSILLRKGSDPSLAKPFLERIVELQPEDLVPKQDLAQVLAGSNDLVGAATQYQEILRAMPSAHLSRALLSEVYMKQNRANEALKVLDQGLAESPDTALLFREKGRVLDRLERDAEAVAAYRTYLRLAPGAADKRVFTERIAQLSLPGKS